MFSELLFMMKNIILDTDIGGDPDDTFALLLGINSPEIKIDLAVTSDEHKGYRASFARDIIKKLELDIPVIKGSDLGNNKYCIIDDLVEPSKNEDFLQKIKEVISRNKYTYYVCISPQTNLAAFLDYAPGLISKFEVIIMGGAINYRKKNVAEHNIRQDSASAIKVFHSDIPKKYVLSDITFNKELEINEGHPIYRKIENSESPIKDVLIKSFQNFFHKLYPSCYMHDPLTLSYLIKPKFLSFEQNKIEINSKGIMQFSESGKLTTVSKNADYQGFMKFLSQRLQF